MNFLPENTAAPESAALAEIEMRGMDKGRIRERDTSPAPMPVNMELPQPSTAVGALYFASSCCPTSPKIHELKTRHAALQATACESKERLQC